MIAELLSIVHYRLRKTSPSASGELSKRSHAACRRGFRALRAWVRPLTLRASVGNAACPNGAKELPNLPVSAVPTATRAASASAESDKATARSEAIYIAEYRVQGAHSVPKIEIEEAIYPYLGPARTEADVENARKALEKLYRDKGMQAVDVQVPQQEPMLLRRGIVLLESRRRSGGAVAG